MKIEQDFWVQLAQNQGAKIRWIPLSEDAYLQISSDAPVIQVVGAVEEELAGGNVLWLL